MRLVAALALGIVVIVAVVAMTAVRPNITDATVMAQKVVVGGARPVAVVPMEHQGLQGVVRRAAKAAAKAKMQALMSTSDFPYTLDKPAGIKAAEARPDDGVARSNAAAMRLASQLSQSQVLPGDVADRAAGQHVAVPSALGGMPHLPQARAPAMPSLAAVAHPSESSSPADAFSSHVAASVPTPQLFVVPPEGELEKELKADTSPIGTADGVKILGDADLLKKSKGPEGTMNEWKAAAKSSGPKVLSDITDDVTSYNPFPNQRLSEKMEIEDVWNKARALAKPAGKLDGTADENKATIDNAVAQASAAAYMAANEAAAVDSYDVSMPNPDMMANKHKAALLGQEKAASHHSSSPMAARAAAVADRHDTQRVRARQALAAPRVEVLAEVVAPGVNAVRARARRDAGDEARRARRLRKEYYEAVGAEEEARRLAGSEGGARRVGDAVAGVASAANEHNVAETGRSESKDGAEVRGEEAQRKLEEALAREWRVQKQLAQAQREDDAVHAEAREGSMERQARALRAKLSVAQESLGGEGTTPSARGGITGAVASILGDDRVAQTRRVVAKRHGAIRVGGDPLLGPFGR